MILFVNGDSHAAAAEAVNPHAFAEDDARYFYMGRAAHPDNLRVSWARRLADTIKATLDCQAESASSNQRIMRTTREWLMTNNSYPGDVLAIIQWSTWEREEWLIDGVYYQVTASGIDDVPPDHQDRYRDYIRGLDWATVTRQAHQEIWQFHQELEDREIKHVFFNGNNHFGSIPDADRYEWGSSYISPYDSAMTWDQWLRRNGFDTVSPKSWHFGREAHSAWARFMLQYVVQNNLI
jgi:hypothetical protein